MWQLETERTHRKHVKYMRTPKDQEHAFRRTAQNTMLVYRKTQLNVQGRM